MAVDVLKATARSFWNFTEEFLTKRYGFGAKVFTAQLEKLLAVLFDRLS
jgi:hypothetical protein